MAANTALWDIADALYARLTLNKANGKVADVDFVGDRTVDLDLLKIKIPMKLENSVTGTHDCMLMFRSMGNLALLFSAEPSVSVRVILRVLDLALIPAPALTLSDSSMGNKSEFLELITPAVKRTFTLSNKHVWSDACQS